MPRAMRHAMQWIRILAAATVLAMALAAYSLAEARRDPVVRRASVALADWPQGAKPIRVALLSDIHIGSPAMHAGRLARIVDQVDALRPDLILIAGDFIDGDDPRGAARYGGAMIGSLRRLHAPLGVVAVPGNHDHATGLPTVRAQLKRAGITLLANQAAERGPLAIGGLDDPSTLHDRMPATLAALRRLSGARVMLAHAPDAAAHLPTDVGLLLVGHTHCGQVVLPFWGSIIPMAPYEARYRCGVFREPGRTIVVTAGLGTSIGPFRLNAPPDLWLLTLGPAR